MYIYFTWCNQSSYMQSDIPKPFAVLYSRTQQENPRNCSRFEIIQIYFCDLHFSHFSQSYKFIFEICAFRIFHFCILSVVFLNMLSGFALIVIVYSSSSYCPSNLTRKHSNHRDVDQPCLCS